MYVDIVISNAFNLNNFFSFYFFLSLMFDISSMIMVLNV